MNALKKLKEINHDKPYLGFTKLEIGFHKIIAFRSVKNKFCNKEDGSDEKSVLVELTDQVIFLPQYVARKISEKDVLELNECLEMKDEIYLKFNGKHYHSG